jgi:hypothetical protein
MFRIRKAIKKSINGCQRLRLGGERERLPTGTGLLFGGVENILN